MNNRSVFKIVFSLAACLATCALGLVAPAQAQQETVSPQASAALKSMRNALERNRALSVSSAVSMGGTKNGEPSGTPMTFAMNAKLQEPDSFLINYTQGDALFTLESDGSRSYFIDGNNKSYKQVETGNFDKLVQSVPDLAPFPAQVFLAGFLGLYSDHSLFDSTIIFKSIARQITPVSMTAVKINAANMRATEVIRKWIINAGNSKSAATGFLYIDNSTHLPIKYVFKVGDDKNSADWTQTYSNWNLSRNQFAANAFTFAPPSDYVELGPEGAIPVGSPAPDFSVVSPDGKTVKLSDYAGKIVIVKFWATWCEPCQASLPHFEKVWRSIQSNPDIAVIAPCVWDKQAAFDKWVKDNIGSKYTFPVYFDPAQNAQSNGAATPYRVPGIPALFVIDKDGKIASVQIGYDGEGDHRLEDALAKLGIKVSE